jgi:hypothetical protein
VRLVHAEPGKRADASEVLRGVAVVTAEVLAMPDVTPASLGVGPRQVTVHEGGDGRSFNIAMVERADDSSVLEWQLQLSPEKAGRVAGALRDAVARGGQVAADARGAEVEKLRKELESIQTKQSILSSLVRGHAEARKEGLGARLARLDAEREALEIDLTAARARAEALREHTGRLEAEARHKADDDAIRPQLERVLKAREQELTRVRDMVKAGHASAQEVAAHEARVAEAEIQLLTRREQVMRGDENGDLLGRLANELAMLSINEAEKEARLNYINQRLPELNPREMTEKSLDFIASQYPTLASEGKLPPLYLELDKRQAELLKKVLAMTLSEVRVEAEPTTAPAP